MVSEELVNRLERLADQADLQQLVVAIYNDLQLLKKAAGIEEEPKEEEQTKRKGRPPKDG